MIIDVHGHITPPWLIKKYPMPPSLADVDGMLEERAQAGIDMTIVGSPVGVGTMMRLPGMPEIEQTPEELRRFHDWLADTVAKHPRQLRAYCYVDPFGDEGALRDAHDTVKAGGFVGLIVNTSVEGEYLDSQRADAFFVMAAELAAPVFLHPPAEPVGTASFRDFRLVEHVARHGDVTASLATLALSGRLQEHPNLRFLGAMGGGAISLLSDRLDQAHEAQKRMPRPPPGRPAPPRYETDLAEKPSQYLRGIHVDTACYSVPTLQANLALVGADHVLFGTDSPPAAQPLKDSVALIESLSVSDEDRRKILGGNAQCLFGLGD